ncbi:MAG: type II toxin-antitoxin system VapC family toxin [Acidobacteriaceae bacterium]
MSRLYMLDTDTISFLVKGRNPTIRDRFRTHATSELVISAVTRAELLYGLKALDPAHMLRVAVKRILEEIPSLSWQAEAAEYYAEMRHQLTTSRQLIGDLDMMIAAHALAIHAVLVTRNERHFSRIRLPLQMENWSKA